MTSSRNHPERSIIMSKFMWKGLLDGQPGVRTSLERRLTHYTAWDVSFICQYGGLKTTLQERMQNSGLTFRCCSITAIITCFPVFLPHHPDPRVYPKCQLQTHLGMTIPQQVSSVAVSLSILHLHCS